MWPPTGLPDSLLLSLGVFGSLSILLVPSAEKLPQSLKILRYAGVRDPSPRSDQLAKLM